LRQPRISSSSAIGSSTSAREPPCNRLLLGCSGLGSLTRLPQLLLERVPVHSVVVPFQFVDEVVDLVHGLPRDDPERDRLAAPPELLPRIPLGELLVWRLDRAGVRERLPLSLLPKDLVDHAASGSTTRRTHSVSSRVVRRRPSRSS